MLSLIVGGLVVADGPNTCPTPARLRQPGYRPKSAGAVDMIAAPTAPTIQASIDAYTPAVGAEMAPIGTGTNFAESRPESAPKKAPVSRLISAPKPKTDTGIKTARKPRASKSKKPPAVTGYSWRRDGSGFELRKTIYSVDPDTGIRKRRLPYVAHLSKSAFAEMRRRHKGAALERAIAEWIASHDR